MAASDLRFGFRDLLAAAFDSCSRLPPFFRDLVERAAIAIEQGLLPRILLPATHDYVDVLRIEFHPVADPPGLLGGNQRRARPEKAVVDGVAARGVRCGVSRVASSNPPWCSVWCSAWSASSPERW